MIELRVKNKNATGFKVDIRDLNGREIEVYNFKLDSNGHISYFIDIANYKNGTYIYTVTVDGMYLKTYKFQVLK